MNPQIVKEWEESVKVIEEMCPRCCHTCTNFTRDLFCYEFVSHPPAEFRDAIDKCDKWTREPF